MCSKLFSQRIVVQQDGAGVFQLDSFMIRRRCIVILGGDVAEEQ